MTFSVERGLRIAPFLPKQLMGSEYVCVFSIDYVRDVNVTVTLDIQGDLHVMFV